MKNHNHEIRRKTCRPLPAACTIALLIPCIPAAAQNALPVTITSINLPPDYQLPTVTGVGDQSAGRVALNALQSDAATGTDGATLQRTVVTPGAPTPLGQYQSSVSLLPVVFPPGTDQSPPHKQPLEALVSVVPHINPDGSTTVMTSTTRVDFDGAHFKYVALPSTTRTLIAGDTAQLGAYSPPARQQQVYFATAGPPSAAGAPSPIADRVEVQVFTLRIMQTGTALATPAPPFRGALRNDLGDYQLASAVAGDSAITLAGPTAIVITGATATAQTTDASIAGLQSLNGNPASQPKPGLPMQQQLSITPQIQLDGTVQMQITLQTTPPSTAGATGQIAPVPVMAVSTEPDIYRSGETHLLSAPTAGETQQDYVFATVTLLPPAAGA